MIRRRLSSVYRNKTTLPIYDTPSIQNKRFSAASIDIIVFTKNGAFTFPKDRGLLFMKKRYCHILPEKLLLQIYDEMSPLIGLSNLFIDFKDYPAIA